MAKDIFGFDIKEEEEEISNDEDIFGFKKKEDKDIFGFKKKDDPPPINTTPSNVTPQTNTVFDKPLIDAEPFQVKKSALEWTTPKPKLTNTWKSAFQLKEEDAPVIDSVWDSLKSGFHNFMGGISGWDADTGEYYNQNPNARISELVLPGLLYGGRIATHKLKTPAQIQRLREEEQKSYRKAIEIGRPLQFSEVQDLGDFITYMKGLIGSSAPQMAGSILSMGTLSPYLLTAEANRGLKEIPDLPLEERMALARSGGFIAAAFENIGLGVLVKGIPKDLLGKVGINNFVAKLESVLAGKMLSRGVQGGATEATTEALQDGTFIMSEILGGKDFQEGEIIHRLKEAGWGGLFLGSGIGVSSPAIQQYAPPLLEKVATPVIERIKPSWDKLAELPSNILKDAPVPLAEEPSIEAQEPPQTVIEEPIASEDLTETLVSTLPEGGVSPADLQKQPLTEAEKEIINQEVDTSPPGPVPLDTSGIPVAPIKEMDEVTDPETIEPGSEEEAERIREFELEAEQTVMDEEKDMDLTEEELAPFEELSDAVAVEEKPKLTVKSFEGEKGNEDHLTRKETGTLDPTSISHLEGKKGEKRGEHRNRSGKEWEDFKADIKENGVKDPILINKDFNEKPVVVEGNHRLDAALELGLKSIPVEINYFGKAEDQGLATQVAVEEKGKEKEKEKEKEKDEDDQDTSFLQLKEEKSTSFREQIYVDLAERDKKMSPNLSVKEKVAILKNRPPVEMEQRLREAVKEKFKLKKVTREAGIPQRKTSADVSMNNMMNLYQNFEGMAAVLGLPLEAMGLEGTLTLKQEKAGGRRKNILGSYFPIPGVRKKDGGIPTKEEVSKQIGKKLTDAEYKELTQDPPFIRIQGRFNSFAHEWGHALDFHILDKLGEGWSTGMTGRSRGSINTANLVGLPEKAGAKNIWNQKDTSGKIKTAFGNLMNAMYFEDGGVAAKILELQAKIAKTRSKVSKAKLEKMLQELEEGSSKLRKNMNPSRFRKDALEGPNPRYYGMPTEMFARAFEAYVAQKMEAQSEGPSFPGNEYISMKDADYMNKNLEIFYPQEEDRNNIFSAFNDLFQALSDEYFEGVAAKSGPGTIIDYQALFDTQGDQRIFSKDAKERANKRVQVHRNLILRQLDRPLRHKDKSKKDRSIVELEDFIMHNFIGSKLGTMITLEGRYSDKKTPFNIEEEDGVFKVKWEKDSRGYEKNFNSKEDATSFAKSLQITEISELIGLLASDPGSERATSRTWSDIVPIVTARMGHMYKSIVDNNNADLFTKEELNDLRNIATSDPDTLARAEKGEVSKSVLKFADDARRLMNKLYEYAKESGLDINYIEEQAYLPRYIDMALVIDKPSQFIEQAKKVFDVAWVNDYGKIDNTNIEQIVSIAKIAEKPVFRDDKDVNKTINKFYNFLSKIRNYKSDIDSLKIEIKSDPSLKEKLDKKKKELDALLSSKEFKNHYKKTYDALQNAFSNLESANWKTKLEVKESDDPAAHSAIASDFLKKRVLPKEADKLMIDFYADPVESLMSYVTGVIKKVEYHKLFGSHKIPDGESKKRADGLNRDYLEYLFNKMAEKGVDPLDIEQLRMDSNSILGRIQYTDLGSRKWLNTMHNYALMGMLGRAAATSLPEPFVVGIKTQSSLKGLQVFGESLDELFGFFNKDAAQRTRLKKQLGALLGVFDDPDLGMMIANRLGNQLQDTPKNQIRLNTFFRRIGLMGLTNSQRRGAMVVGIKYLKELGDQWKNPVGTNDKAISDDKKMAELELIDLGIPEKSLKKFSKFIQEFNIKDFNKIQMTDGNLSDMGELLAISINRITRRSIQDPLIASRPRYAEHPLGRFVYSIQSFNYSFHRNVIIAEAKRLERTKKHFGNARTATVFAKMLGPMAQLYLGHYLVSTARLFLTDHDRWEEEKKKGNLGGYIANIAASRTGWMGIAEPMYQTLYAIRYQRDFANIAIGATGTFWIKHMEDLIKYFQDDNNSPNTTHAEEQALRSLYHLFVIPAIIHSVSNPTSLASAGVLAAPILGSFAAIATSSSVEKGIASALIKMIYGKDPKLNKKSKIIGTWHN